MIKQDVLDELKSKHGEVFTVEIRDLDFAFRVPTSGENDRCVGTIADNKRQAPQAMRQLVRDCYVHPPAEELKALLEKYSGIAARLANEALKAAALEDTELAKKA